jgi:biotin transport system substrate-specific component
MQSTLTQTAPATSLSSFASSIPGKLLLGFAATLAVAIAAHIAVPLPFTPVPLTLQPLAVLGVGLAFGPVGGFFTMLAYLAEGACGLPVFAPSPSGLSGIAQLFGPTGGFLMAYPIVAAIAGSATRKLQSYISRFFSALLASTLATTFLILCGASWLMFGASPLTHFAHLNAQQAWVAAVAPFLPGEAIKVLIAAGLYASFPKFRKA